MSHKEAALHIVSQQDSRLHARRSSHGQEDGLRIIHDTADDKESEPIDNAAKAIGAPGALWTPTIA